VPLPRTRAEDARPLPPPVPAAAPGADTALIVAIQRELARQGLYAGTIDGIAGSRTRAAIAAYEATAGLPVTGEPDAALLAAIDDPVPAADPPTPTATIAAPEQHGDAGVVGGAPAVADPAATGQRYRRVQAALNQSGYGPIAVDGRPGAETAAAIRRFELDNGLDITGEAGDVVIARLVTIGAIAAP
jgi:peptidoglycan hydrolase-like protein with peptidoglycan-binding domain